MHFYIKHGYQKYILLNFAFQESNRIENQKVNDDTQKTPIKKITYPKTLPEADRQSLEKLHQKAQALLNMGSISTTSTEDSSSEHVKLSKPKQSLKDLQKHKIQNHKTDDVNKAKPKISKDTNHVQRTTNSVKKHDSHINSEHKVAKKKSKPHSTTNSVKIEKNGPVIAPGRYVGRRKTLLYFQCAMCALTMIAFSPMKIIRAKITEEVNNRLISAGVDPLRSGLPKNDYQKRKMRLQQEIELKTKVSKSDNNEKF